LAVATPGTLTSRDGTRAFFADARYFPVLWVTWWGEANELLIRRYFEWNNAMLLRASAEGSKFANITDARCASLPSATVRRLVANLTDESPPAGNLLNVGTYLIHDNAFVRGAVTAVQWLSQRDLKIVAVSDLRSGIARAVASLAKSGISAPQGLDAERCSAPTMPAETAHGG